MMKRSFLLVLAGASSIVLNASGCEEPETYCTLIGCTPSSFNLLQDDWAEGDYELEVSFRAPEDVTFLCEFRVAGDPNDLIEDDAGVDAPSSRCRQTKGTQGGTVNVFVYDGVRLEMYPDPATLQLELRRAGQTLFEDTLTPQYTESYPNGPDCGTCRTTDTDIEL